MKSERINRLLQTVRALPEVPGCYQYLDKQGAVIYVGKAKNLKRRVSSYFVKEQQSLKTKMLVSRIEEIRYVVVKSDEDALLLENNLIKRYNPRYNILLKDGKTYPSIALTTGEYLPRVFPTRNRNVRGAQFFGPYSHVGTMHALLDLLKELYALRPCRTPMTEEGVKEGKYQPCLEFHLHRCGAPCVERQNHDEYMKNVEACKEILRGNTANVARMLREQMAALAEELRFEEAQLLKEKYEVLESFRAKSEVVSSTVHNVDVFNIESDEKMAYVNFLHVINGAINQALTVEVRKKLDETDEEILSLAVVELRERFNSQSKEVVLPFEIGLPESVARQIVPQKGDKRKLLDLSRLNVKQYKFDRLKQAEKLNPEQKQVRLMKEIQRDLQLEHLPVRIELFDNSNISGADAVAACVVFEKLKPAKNLYRKYIIKTVVGADDYASMKEVCLRRYGRLKEEGERLPDLIIADGGRGQMEVIRQAVEGELGLQIPIAGLAKNDRHRTKELLYGFPPVVVGLDVSSQLFKTLTAMQDEVHRFAISFHRSKRSARQTSSVLDSVDGVGKKTKELLLRKFGSVKRVREASEDALCSLLGAKRGKKVYDSLKQAK